MSQEQPVAFTPSTFTRHIQFALRREALIASGRGDAIEFAWNCQGNLQELKEEREETENILSDPERIRSSMAPNTTTRIYREAYLAGLQDAIKIIEEGSRADANSG